MSEERQPDPLKLCHLIADVLVDDGAEDAEALTALMMCSATAGYYMGITREFILREIGELYDECRKKQKKKTELN